MPTLRTRALHLAATEPTLREPLGKVLASDTSDLVWASKVLEEVLSTLKDVVDVLDARQGGSSLSDDFSEVGKISDMIRRTTSRDLSSASRMLRKLA